MKILSSLIVLTLGFAPCAFSKVATNQIIKARHCLEKNQDPSVCSAELQSIYQEFDRLNGEIKELLLNASLGQRTVRKEIRRKIHALGSLAQKIGGRKNKRAITRSYRKALRIMSRFDGKYHEVLMAQFSNGMTGKEILLAALNPMNTKKLDVLYQAKKTELSGTYSGKELGQKAFEAMMTLAREDEDLGFLFFEEQENLVEQKGYATIIDETCLPKFGEESFHLLIFGFNRCTSENYVMDRWTVGPGFYSAAQGSTKVLGVKLEVDYFSGIGLRAQLGAYFGVGISAYVGNGLMITIDTERGYGIYAGASYLSLKPL